MKWINFLLLAGLGSSSTFAMTQTDICSYRARLVESFAISRDAGKSEAQTAAEVKSALRRVAPNVDARNIPSMKSYVNLVYQKQNRNITPEMFRLSTEISCLRGD
jgi:hypothetical protein